MSLAGRRALVALALLVACSRQQAAAPAGAPAGAPGRVVISVLGTSDLHGHLERLPLVAGYVANVRAARQRDGGGVILVDAGDMWQGTLESNLGEGAAVIEAMNVIGYDAAAVGNHEFDFGPVGPAATARGPDEDRFGALEARAAEAKFPLLAANLRLEATGRPPDWPNVRPAALVERAGVKIGLVGVTTEDTTRTTIAANVQGIEVVPLAEAIAAEARALRAAGAVVVVVAAHAGGKCKRFDRPEDLDGCDPDEEIMRVARALPAGVVDVIVAGHTHQGVAHVVNGVAVIQSYANGRAFGRVDLTIDRAAGRVVERLVRPPTSVEHGASYEGAPVAPDRAVAEAIADDVERAAARRAEPLGVRLETTIERAYDQESALGNLFTDLMREATGADVAITNGGGLRADLPAGELTYGQLHQAYPFDNLFARGRLRGRQLRDVIARNLSRGGGILSVSGLRVRARCERGELVVALARVDGRPVGDDEALEVVTSDFLATGGDGAFEARIVFAIDDGPPIRDAMAEVLRRRGGALRADAYLGPRARRLELPGRRPVRCER